MIKEFYQKHKKVINIGGTVLLGTVCFVCGRNYENYITDKQLVVFGDNGITASKIIDGSKYTLTVIKEIIEK